MIAESRGGPEVAREQQPGVTAQASPFDLAGVVREYESPLLRYAARLIGARYDEAQDVVQDVFLKLHKQVDQHGFASIGNMRCWLYRVAHNLAMDYGRSRRRRRELEAKALSDPSVMEKLRGSELKDARDYEKEESAQVALAAVETLPDEQKNVILLKIIQGLTLKEISTITGMKIGTVNYRLTQGLRALAVQLKGELGLGEGPAGPGHALANVTLSQGAGEQ